MRVQKIKILNILGIDELEIVPGAVTVIEGANGTGKTSVLEAVRAIVSGGNDRTLVRAGSETAEVSLELDDGTEISRRFTPGGSTLKCSRGLADIRKPADYIRSLIAERSLNPVEFLSLSDRERIQLLVGLFNLSVPLEAGEVPLEEAERLRAAAYSQRTGASRAAKEAEAGARAIEAAGEAIPEDAIELAHAAHRVADAHAADLAAELFRVDEAHDAARREAQIARDHAIERARAEYAALVDKLRSDYEAAERAVRAEIEPRWREAQEEAAALGAQAGRLQTEKERRRLQADQQARAEKLRLEEAALSGEIDAIDVAIKASMATIPIDGVTVEDGKLLVGGIQWDRLNTAQQIRHAVDLAIRQAGALGLILVDGLERLDQEQFEAFQEAAAQSGCQFLVTRVTEGPLEVRA